jgi:hypothetical protein
VDKPSQYLVWFDLHYIKRLTCNSHVEIANFAVFIGVSELVIITIMQLGAGDQINIGPFILLELKDLLFGSFVPH